MDRQNTTKRTSVASRLILAAGFLLAATILVTTSDAAIPGAGTAALAINTRQGVTPMLAGVLPVVRGIVVPMKPTPRSPFQPPSWVSAKPPWIR